eukprot:3464382-Prymnesium_polylepis.1
MPRARQRKGSGRAIRPAATSQHKGGAAAATRARTNVTRRRRRRATWQRVRGRRLTRSTTRRS